MEKGQPYIFQQIIKNMSHPLPSISIPYIFRAILAYMQTYSKITRCLRMSQQRQDQQPDGGRVDANANTEGKISSGSSSLSLI